MESHSASPLHCTMTVDAAVAAAVGIDDRELADAFAAYALRWPDEAGTVAHFAALLADADDPFRRERLAGHFTASCWLVD